MRSVKDKTNINKCPSVELEGEPNIKSITKFFFDFGYIQCSTAVIETVVEQSWLQTTMIDLMVRVYTCTSHWSWRMSWCRASSPPLYQNSGSRWCCRPYVCTPLPTEILPATETTPIDATQEQCYSGLAKKLTASAETFFSLKSRADRTQPLMLTVIFLTCCHVVRWFRKKKKKNSAHLIMSLESQTELILGLQL